MKTGRRYVKIAVAFLLATSTLLASCKVNTETSVNIRTPQTVSADDPWYETRVIDLAAGYDVMSWEHFREEIIGLCNDYVAVSVSASKTVPAEVYLTGADDSGYYADNLDIYDLDGNLINRMDRQDILDQNGYTGETYLYYDGIEENKILVSIDAYEEYHEYEYRGLLDPLTGVISQVTSITQNREGIPEDSNYEGSYVVNGYKISRYWIYGSYDTADDSTYFLRITDPQGGIHDMDLRQIFPGLFIYDITSFFDTGNGKVMISCNGTGNFFLELDLSTMNISEYTDDEWLSRVDFYNMSYADGYGFVYQDVDAIKRLDFESRTIEDVFRYDWSLADFGKLDQYNTFRIDEDRIIMGGCRELGHHFFNNYREACELIILDRADTNPNAGKTVLTAGFVQPASCAVSDAVISFNRENSDYFIRYDMSYITGFSEPERINNIVDMNTEYITVDHRSEVSAKLEEDLMSGNSPDIIFDACCYQTINNDDCLLDLSEILPEEECFDHVIDMCRTGEKLYQIPLAFRLNGISVDVSDITAGTVGFTYDDYLSYVDEICDGSDPINSTREESFILIMSTMSDMFTGEDGRPCFDNEEFRTLASFVKDNMPSEPDEDALFYSPVLSNGKYITLDSFGDYLDYYAWGNTELRIMGLPSPDGRGPAAEIFNSAAIASSTPSADGCKEFVRTLLTSDVQADFAYYDCIPITMEAFSADAASAVEEYNIMIANRRIEFTDEDLADMGLPDGDINGSVTETFMNIINSCSCVNRTDPRVVEIVSDEMQAYFDGSSSIDDVIGRINARIGAGAAEGEDEAS